MEKSSSGDNVSGIKLDFYTFKWKSQWNEFFYLKLIMIIYFTIRFNVEEEIARKKGGERKEENRGGGEVALTNFPTFPSPTTR